MRSLAGFIFGAFKTIRNTAELGGASVTQKLGRPNADDSVSRTDYSDKCRHPIGIFGARKAATLQMDERGKESGGTLGW